MYDDTDRCEQAVSDGRRRLSGYPGQSDARQRGGERSGHWRDGWRGRRLAWRVLWRHESAGGIAVGRRLGVRSVGGDASGAVG